MFIVNSTIISCSAVHWQVLIRLPLFLFGHSLESRIVLSHLEKRPTMTQPEGRVGCGGRLQGEEIELPVESGQRVRAG